MPDLRWTSVSAPYIRPRASGERDAWSEEASQHGHVGSNQLREVAEVVPPPGVAEALRLGPNETAVVRRRLVLLDDQPTELTDSYYPSALALGTALAEQRKIPGGAVTLLAKLGYETHKVEERVQARPSTEEEQETLRIAPEEWVFVLTRTTRAIDGSPFEVAVMTMIATGRELQYEMTVQ
ncbi:UTRA domain-containing protein [Nonomuraea sp. NPDC003804]|uniref:GntR family transcriptional regulator n=1 Tax=Nonomuraea sp. NPDC003804 TaxID=3154547 RepID=UPI0033A714E5